MPDAVNARRQRHLAGLRPVSRNTYSIQMPLDLNDTIAALASPPGPAERGIVRVSGGEVRGVLARVFRASGNSGVDWLSSTLPRRYSGMLDIPSIGVPLPTALMWWPTRRSFTGQPMGELHLPGSPPLLDAVLEHLFDQGARPARRGEFTLRAFLAGRIDLLQAEAVLGVIDATDHDELQQALLQLGGGMTVRMRDLRADLLAILGDLEAGLDFVDEDIEFVSRDEVCRRLSLSLQTLGGLMTDAETRLPSGWRRQVVLAGLPNAGKSTLFNRLTEQNKAIVSAIPGTTRDYLTCPLTMSGAQGQVEVDLIDTAGWEDAADLVMHRAQQLRSEQSSACDLVIWCSSCGNTRDEHEQDRQCRQQLEAQQLPLLRVFTQCDTVRDASVGAGCEAPSIMPTPVAQKDACRVDDERGDLRVSAMTGERIEDLRAEIVRRLLQTTSARGELLASTAARCRDSLKRATAALESALQAASRQHGDELIAMDLRQCLHELGVISGEVYTDDILDHIFSRFCIGK